MELNVTAQKKAEELGLKPSNYFDLKKLATYLEMTVAVNVKKVALIEAINAKVEAMQQAEAIAAVDPWDLPVEPAPVPASPTQRLSAIDDLWSLPAEPVPVSRPQIPLLLLPPAQEPKVSVVAALPKFGDERRLAVQPQNADLKKLGFTALKQQALELLQLPDAKAAARWAKQQGLTNIDLCYKDHWAALVEVARSHRAVAA